MLKRKNLHDVWRCQNTTERDYTFYSNPPKTFTRLDMFLVTRALMPQIKECKIGTITLSDHALITLTFTPSRDVPAPFSWRNNTYILSVPKHQEYVRAKLEEYFSRNSSRSLSENTIWNAHKAVMRGVLIQSSRVKKERNSQLDILLQNFKALEETLRSAPTLTTHSELSSARIALRTLLMSNYEYQLKKTKFNMYHSFNKPNRMMARRVAMARGP